MINAEIDKILLEFLPFDTEIFGIRCGRVRIMNDAISKEGLESILEKAREQQIKHLVAKVPSEWVEISNLMEDFNFRFKVCSLYLEKKLVKIENRIEDISPYERDSDSRLISITEKAFSSGTRFHFEQKFQAARIVELHRRWINNLIKDRNVRIYVHRDGATITGYVTVKIQNNSERGHIELFAVDEDYRGRSIGTKLLSALDRALCNEIDILSVMTESINYPALKTYFNNRFIIKKSWNVFHFTSA